MKSAGSLHQETCNMDSLENRQGIIHLFHFGFFADLLALFLLVLFCGCPERPILLTNQILPGLYRSFSKHPRQQRSAAKRRSILADLERCVCARIVRRTCIHLVMVIWTNASDPSVNRTADAVESVPGLITVENGSCTKNVHPHQWRAYSRIMV